MEKRITRSFKNKKRTIEETTLPSLLIKNDTLDLNGVIDLCEYFQSQKKDHAVSYRSLGINKRTIKRLTNIIDELRELNSIIGIEDAKQSILEHILYLAQNLNSEEDLNHIQIVGEPGVGKTTLACIIGRIYAGLGFLENGEVISITRADLIGEHLGSTSIKTEQTLNECIGNVLFIDEVYSFGCNDRRDSFSKECLDYINRFLSENRNDVLCIIAGYEQDIQECVFSVNKGLERRFPFKYVLKQYKNTELKRIFINQVKSSNWFIDDNLSILDEIFNENSKNIFTSSGGDTEILLMRCKMAHSSRIFTENKRKIKKKTLSAIDVKKGYEMFMNTKQLNKQNERFSMLYV